MTVTIVIAAITVLVSILAFNNRELFRRLAFNAYDIKHFGNHYRFLSYALIHADLMHLAINMLVFYSFGRLVESYYGLFFGTRGILYFILLYVGGTALSTLPSFGKHKDDFSYTAVGASGAVSAVLFASILFDPMNRIFIFPIPIGIPAFLFGVLYLGYSWYMDRKKIDNVGHDVHFWGAVFGFAFTLALKPALFLNLIRILGETFSG
jgi:membrane associated rhomboid family serine protease